MCLFSGSDNSKIFKIYHIFEKMCLRSRVSVSLEEFFLFLKESPLPPELYSRKDSICVRNKIMIGSIANMYFCSFIA